MKVEIRIEDRVEPLAEEWEALARLTHSPPFLWPGWVDAWWRAFGSGKLQILATYRDGDLRGIVPMRRFRGTLGSTTNPHTPLFGFLAADERAAADLSSAIFARGAPHITLSFLSSADASVDLIHSAAADARYRLLTRSIQASPYVATDGEWDAYEGGLRRKLRSELRRRQRRLEEEGRLTLDVEDGSEGLENLLEEGFFIEDSGWKGVSGTSINSEPATRRFYTEVARWAADSGWLRLAFLRLDGRAIAFDYALEYNKVHYLLKTGYDPGHGRFAPGMIIRHMMLARAFANETLVYDFLGEDYPWKHQWTNAWQERIFLQMFAPTTLGFLDRVFHAYGRPVAGRAKRYVGKRIHFLTKRASKHPKPER